MRTMATDNTINNLFIEAMSGRKKDRKQYSVIVCDNEAGEVLRVLGDSTFGGYSYQVACEVADDFDKNKYFTIIQEI